MSLKEIRIRGAREHNLKGVDLDIPRDRLVVITGLSGSGKSSLAFDTIYAEGQRKYMESLSAYARQFLDQLQKPDIESIEGLPPTIAIEQRHASHNPRSTVATTTEIYDYLRLLFARVGQPRCWHVMEEGTDGEGTKGRRDEGTKGRRDEGTKGRRDEGTEGRRDEGTEGRRDEGTKGAEGDRLQPFSGVPEGPRSNNDGLALKKADRATKGKKKNSKRDVAIESNLAPASSDSDVHSDFHPTPDTRHPKPALPLHPKPYTLNPHFCHHPIASQSATQIVDQVYALPEATKLMVLAPVVRGKKGHHQDIFESLVRQGFVRARVNGNVIDLREIKGGPGAGPLSTKEQRFQAHTIEAVIDRIVIKHDDATRQRLADSIELSLKLAEGLVVVSVEGRHEGTEVRRHEGTEARRHEGKKDSPASETRHEKPETRNSPSETLHPKPYTLNPSPWSDTLYSEKYACPLHPECSLGELEPRLFSFNSPYGACPTCSGLGTILEFDPQLIVPDESVPVGEGAIEAWKKLGLRMNIFHKRIIRRFCKDFGVDPATPFNKLSKQIQRILLRGTTPADEAKYDTFFEGVIPNLQRRFENTESEFIKEKLHAYLSEAPCETCRGSRLKVEAMHVFIEAEGTEGRRDEGTKGSEVTEIRRHGHFSAHDDSPGTPERAKERTNPKSEIRNPKSSAPSAPFVPSSLRPSVPSTSNIRDVTAMTIEQAAAFFSRLRLSQEQQQIAAPILKEIQARLGFMLSVGLGYLTLDRTTSSLSGGEAQRIRLATQVGSGLVGCCYVLDEPTIGLHQRDNDRLIKTLRHLTDIGNTVIVVEHDEDTIRTADWIIDIGPGPGRHGGRVVAQGTLADVLATADSPTAKYLRGDLEIPTPAADKRRKLDHKRAIVVKGARENNLKNIDIAFPLGGIVCVTGVSGSGKSTLVNQILLRAAKKQVLGSREKPGEHDKVVGLTNVDRIIEVDQSPIGRTPRSNPATYVGVFDLVRDLFSQTKEAKIRGYQPGRFSFNVKGGRCEACQGQGTKKIEMHFLPDVFVECEVCKGKRYNRETLEVRYRSKSIAEVLSLTIEESLAFFDNFSNITQLLAALNDVGLSYVQLGQASTTLSGGEAQRVKLATELGKRPTGHTLYILDEPTTGLHFADVDKLLRVLHRLADAGNTVIVIEHNLDVIKAADWIIDLGPEGGERGGTIVASGTPEQVMETPGSYTGQFLAKHLKREGVMAG